MRERMIDRLTDLIGYQPTARLIRAFGGRRLYIPATATDDHPIHWVVGPGRAQALCDHYGGQVLQLPDEQIVILELRNQRIAAEYRKGASVSALAQDYGLTCRWIRRILEKTNTTTGAPPQ